MTPGQLFNGPLEPGKIELVPIDIKEECMLIFDAPGRADTEIGELAILVRSIPALQYLIKTPRLFIGTVKSEPFPFDNDAGGRLWVLLILRGEIVIGHRATLRFQRRVREQSLVQNLTLFTMDPVTAVRR